MPVRPGLAVVAALLGSLTPALADVPTKLTPTEFAAVRADCERKEAAAKTDRAHDGSDLVVCAQRYLDYFRQDPTDPTMDSVLYNAGVMFEMARSVSAATQTFALLRRSFPASKLAVKGLAREAKSYADIANYDRAAALLEEYAKKYAGEKDAYDAMSDAIYYRKAIGDDDKAIENTKYFIRTFGTKRPQEAANAHFSLTSIYAKRGDRDALVKHLRDYIRQYGSRGGDDRLVIAYAKIGQALWERSCPAKQIDGLCVRVARAKRPAPAHCGADAPVALTVVARDQGLVKEAIASFAAAMKQFEKVGGRTGGDDGGARYYHATAKLTVADRDLEEYLTLTVPADVTFDQADRRAIAQKRFSTWMGDLQKQAMRLLQQYEQVLMAKDAATSIAAAERIARVQEKAATALMTAELPQGLRTGPNKTERAKAYCDELAEIGEPLRDRAAESYGVCLSKATGLGWFDDAARSCERALGRIAPEQFPPLRETVASAAAVATVTASEPPL